MTLLRRMYANLEEYVSAFLVGLMILCLMLQVGVRIVIGAGLAWTEELSRFCFIWAVYVGASLAAKRAAHVRISAQFLLAPVKVRLFFRIVADSIWIGFNIFFVFLTIDMTREAFAFPEVSPTLGWVKAWIEMIIPISFAMMTLRTVEVYITHWRAGTLASMVDFVEEAQK